MVSSYTPAAHQALLPHISHDDRGSAPVVLDVSFSSVVVRLGGRVARIARNADAQAGHRREARVLGVFAGRVPVAVPLPLELVEAGPGLPFGAAIQPFLDGHTMRAEEAARLPNLAPEIARTFRAVHAIPAADFPQGWLPALDPGPEADRLWRETEEHLRRHLGANELARLEARLEECRELPDHPRVVCHGDPWFGNFLIGPDGSLAALLDFEDVCIADPAVDLSALAYLPERFIDAALEAYGAEGPRSENRSAASLRDRIPHYRLLRELDGLAYCLRNGQDDELEHSLRDVMATLG